MKYQTAKGRARLLPLLYTGMSIRQIAFELDLCDGTVSTYIKKLCKETGVSGRFGLMARRIAELEREAQKAA